MPMWTWRYEDLEGRVVTAPGSTDGTDTADLEVAEGFGAQADAESWIGEHWRALLAEGVESAHLLLDGDVVYGPLSLRPAV